jgi:hypothetical protein
MVRWVLLLQLMHEEIQLYLLVMMLLAAQVVHVLKQEHSLQEMLVETLLLLLVLQHGQLILHLQQ